MKRFMNKVNDMLTQAALAEFNIYPPLPEELVEETLDVAEVERVERIEIPHAEPGAFQVVKSMVEGHGEQTVLPDDCGFGDNDLCYVDA